MIREVNVESNSSSFTVNKENENDKEENIEEEILKEGPTIEEKKMLNVKIALGLIGFLGFIVTFVLEVFGASGAIWFFFPINFFIRVNI